MSKNIRQSHRSNFGQPPLRYPSATMEPSGHFSETELEVRRSSQLQVESTRPTAQNVKTAQNLATDGSIRSVSVSQTRSKDSTSTHSKKGTSTHSSNLKRRILEAKLKAAEEQAHLETEKEQREFERQTNLIDLKLKLTEAEIEEEDNLSHSGASISRKSFEPPVEDDRQCSINKVANWFQQTDKDNRNNNKDNQRTDKIDFLLARQTCQKELPIFSGDPTEWPRFISKLRRSTDICGYSDADNMDRLDRCLKGKARTYVESLLMVPNNFEIIISSLQRRYGQPRFIINTLIDKAKQTPPPKDGHFESLIDYASVVYNLAATAEMLRCESYMTNPQLLDELTDKLPYNLKLKWGKQLEKSSSGFATLSEFSKWLNSISDRAIMVYTPKLDFKNDRSEKQINKKQTVCVTTTTKTDMSKNPVTCEFCKKNFHIIENCNQFKKKDMNTRWQFVRDKKLCFSCLKSGHCIFDCNDKKECNILDCKRFHNPILHESSSVRDDSHRKIETCGQTTEVKSQKYSSNQVYLQILPVTLHGPNGSLATFAMLDTGSTVTLIEAEICKSLGIDGELCPLTHKGLNTSMQRETDSRKVSLSISSSSGDKFFNLKDARTVKNLPLPTQSIRRKQLQKWKHLQQIDISEMNYAQPKILIGQDNLNLIIPSRCIKGPPNSPVAARTELGWVLSGKVVNFPADVQDNFFVRHNEEDDLHQLVKQYFSTENFGVKIIHNTPRSQDDLKALEILNDTTKRIQPDRFETGLLWKPNFEKLPESRKMALKRLENIERKMDKDPKLRDAYCAKIEEYLNKGYLKKLTTADLKIPKPRIWYLPHFAVFNPNKPGKLRIVLDAAARSHGQSLNDALFTGPDLFSPLVDVLMKFRQHKIGFTADIKEMFHQVRIRGEDNAAQRLLWRGTDRQREPDTYEMTVMIFGAACSPCSALFVKDKNAQECNKDYPEVTKAIIQNHYVDDYLDSKDTNDDALQMINDVIKIHKQGGFQICNWTCSSSEVLHQIPEDLRANSMKSLNSDLESPIERVLGLYWKCHTDIFIFNQNLSKIDPDIVDGKQRPTKREILRVVMSIFDPLGFLTPFHVKAKIIIQDTWRCGIGWDDELPDDIFNNWKIWLGELQELTKYSIPRCYTFSSNTTLRNMKNIDIHVFCDASQQAFSAVAYFRMETIEGNIHTAFIMSKSRVAPVKHLSIPRLELQAAVMASRMTQTIKNAHDIRIDKIYFWTDSRTVLCWLRQDSRCFKSFVAHRVGEIYELTNVNQWNWVPTDKNVADEATRNNCKCDLSQNSRWLNGPEFLRHEMSEWPQEIPDKHLSDDERLSEEIENKVFFTTINFNDSLPNIDRFSSWMRLIRSTAWIIHFLNCCKSPTNRSTMLGPDEIENAIKLWSKQSQLECFPKDIEAIKSEKPLPTSSRLRRLSPFIDEMEVLRLKGRIKMAPNISEDAKFPIILDSNHKLTKLLIHWYHVKMGHHGRESVLNELRQKYWILNARAAVKSSWNNCQICKNTRVKPQVPEMGLLPPERLTSHVRPFAFTGMDYFGPIQVTVKRSHEKRYGVLFTCLTTRAVHLEIAASLTTDSCIMAIRRFISRRGYPLKIFSDNGTNLKGSDTELKEALQNLNQTQINDKLTTKGIEWKFIPPASPHMGGCWERLVQSVKKALKTTLKQRYPKEETLQTLFAEAENIINSRPLTHVSLDSRDEEALTPNHFLLGCSSPAPVPGIFQDVDVSLRKQWRIAQRLADHFWQRWVKEYLPTLLKRDKWTKTVRPVKIGDVVVIVDPALQRNHWPKGVITATHPGPDGLTRVVDVHTATGTFRRPVTKIGVLDVN